MADFFDPDNTPVFEQPLLGAGGISPRRDFRFWKGACVLAFAILAYWGSAKNGFVWDDHILIENNPLLQSPPPLKKMISPSFYAEGRSVMGAARPLFMLSLAADRKLWGMNPAGYHVTNVLLHGAASLAAYGVALEMMAGDPAFLSGLLFALHPVHTEAVDAISFRTDLLAALFVLIGFWLYAACGARGTSWAKAALLLGSAFFYFLGLLSKEMAITLPALALWGDLTAWRGARSWRLRAAAMILYAAAAAPYLLYRSHRTGYSALPAPAPAAVQRPKAKTFRRHTKAKTSLRNPKAKTPRRRLKDALRTDASAAPALERKGSYPPSQPQWSALYKDRRMNLLSMSEIFAFYSRLLIFPLSLQADRAPPLPSSWKTPSVWQAWLSLALVAVLLAWALMTGRRVLSFGIGWALIALAPVSNVIPIYNPVAERYLYLVSAGPCWAGAWALGALARRLAPSASRIVLALSGAVILVPYGVRTYLRNLDWRSDASLFSGSSGENARIHYNRGFIAQERGDLAQAAKEYRRALVLNPRSFEALSNLGGIEEGRGNVKAARDDYRRAVALAPKAPVPYDALGLLVEAHGEDGDSAPFPQRGPVRDSQRMRKARELFQMALDMDPDFVPARMHLARNLAESGNVLWAIDQFNDVLKRDPSQKKAYLDVALLYDAQGRYREAEAALRKAISLDSRNAEFEMNMGVVCHHQGRDAEALKWLDRAKTLAPLEAPVRYNLGIVDADMGRLDLAQRELRSAVELQPRYADALYNLAVVEQKLGHDEEASKNYEKAIEAEPGRVQAMNNLGGLYERRGELAKAREVLKRAAALSPRLPALRVNLGNVYLREGKVAEAAQEYSRAIEYSSLYREPPSNLAVPLANLALCRIEEGRAAEGERLARRAARDNPRYAPAYLILARALKAQGKIGPAREVLRILLRMDPSQSKARRELRRLR